MALYSSSLVLKWRKMIDSFTSASVAKSRVLVPLNPFFPNNSIAVAMICCRRSFFIVSTYLHYHRLGAGKIVTETYPKLEGDRSTESGVRRGHENKRILPRPGASWVPGLTRGHGVEFVRPTDRHLQDA